MGSQEDPRDPGHPLSQAAGRSREMGQAHWEFLVQPMDLGEEMRMEGQLQVVRRWTRGQGQLTWTLGESCLICTVWYTW